MREAGISNQKYLNQSIVKAAAVLDLFTLEQYELGISTIAAQLDMPVSTTTASSTPWRAWDTSARMRKTGSTAWGSSALSWETGCGCTTSWPRWPSPYLTELSQLL